MHGNYVDLIIVHDKELYCFMLISMINVLTLQLTVVIFIQHTFGFMNTIFSHLDFSKYQNMRFNLNNVTGIHSVPYFVGYLLTSLNENFRPPTSMVVCQ